jgi:hypothetical protein
MSAKVQAFANICQSYLHDIRRFVPDGKLTLIIRHDGDAEGDMVVTADDLAEVRAVIDRSIARQENAK